MVQIKHDDRLVYCGTGEASDRHRAKLVFVPGMGPPLLFEGKSIPGVCRVDRENYNKNGKWSYTEWTISVGDGVFMWTQVGGVIRCLNWSVPDLEAPTCRYATVLRWADVEVPHDVFRAFGLAAAARLDENEKPI